MPHDALRCTHVPFETREAAAMVLAMRAARVAAAVARAASGDSTVVYHCALEAAMESRLHTMFPISHFIPHYTQCQHISVFGINLSSFQGLAYHSLCTTKFSRNVRNYLSNHVTLNFNVFMFP